MEKLLAIFDTDNLYASRLMEYFKKSNWKGFEILLFTKRESLIDFLKYQAVDILLLGESALFEELPKENIKYVFWLCADKMQTKDKHETIYKYQAAGRIVSEVISGYTRLEDNNQKESHGEIRFIAIFPPVPGGEKISYSWSLAKNLSNISKVLYIPFDLLPTTFIPNQDNSGQSMSELLYYLRERKSDYMDKLKSYLNYSEKLSYLSGPIHGFDLLSISREDIGKLMDDIKKYTDYETVIFYLGIYTEASMEAIIRSNEIHITSCNSPFEELVIEEWERQMELIGVSVKKLKINRIKLPIGQQPAQL
ncbi:MAG: hypothetical protein EWM47_10305 [Anaerolineaceae bacterium]|nr:MAG: hypothetical protein EWM47_10305 [Anaerolineaceae bacterium]